MVGMREATAVIIFECMLVVFWVSWRLKLKDGIW